MTSSFKLSKRFQEADTWSFGSWDEHYIRPWGECHPDFVAIPIGHPEGVKVCVRRRRDDGSTFEHNPNIHKHPSEWNGLHRNKFNLYDPTVTSPIQDYEPHHPADRRAPNEDLLVNNDHLHRDIRYNGTGLDALRTPETRCDGSVQKYDQYAFDHNPLAPPKYDVTRLHQPYLLWRSAQEYHRGESSDSVHSRHHDLYHNDRIV